MTIKTLHDQMQKIVGKVEKYRKSEFEKISYNLYKNALQTMTGLLMNTPGYFDYRSCQMENRTILVLAKVGSEAASSHKLGQKMEALEENAELMEELIAEQLTLSRRIFSILGFVKRFLRLKW